MTVLNIADVLKVGSLDVLSARVGRTEVWAPPGSEVDADLGDTGTGGAGGWPTSANRALMTKVTLPHNATIKQFNMWMAAESADAGDRFKGLIYAADNTGGYPGTRLLVSPPTPPSTGIGAELLSIAIADILVPGQEVWIGYVCDGGSGAGNDTDSGGVLASGTIMLNSGEVNYASPPSTAGLWPGGPGPYSNVPSLWFDYTYTP